MLNSKAKINLFYFSIATLIYVFNSFVIAYLYVKYEFSIFNLF